MPLHDIPSLNPRTWSKGFVSCYPVVNYFGPWGQRIEVVEELGGGLGNYGC
jgi:hypothetical protein